MRILIVRNYPSYMDVKNNTYNIQEVGLAKALVRKGHICDIVFWTNKKEEDAEIFVENYGNITVFYRYGKTMLKNTVFIDCKNLFEQYDIIQPCEYNQIQAWLLAKKYPQKTVIYHGPYYSQFNKRYNAMCKLFDAFFLKKYIKQNTKFLVKSKLAEKFLISKQIKSENICTAGVGIDVQMLSNGSSECNEPLYLSMKNDKSDLKLLYIGRFEERRNVIFIIEVFKNVLKINGNASLYMIGTGEKRYMDKVFEHIKESDVQDKVFWQEKMQQQYLSNIYKLSDFFLLPTEYEIFGMVLLEAMYYENVVFTTQNGGSSTLMKNGENGIIIDDLDEKQWSDKIIKLYKDNYKAKIIRKNASETIKNNYTWDKLTDKFIYCYSALKKDNK